MNIEQLRREYALGRLHESMVDPDPIKQFGLWMHEALLAEIVEPYAMNLATATLQGIPSARMVLLRKFDDRGFAFFTNYQSRKGRELSANPHAALTFYWAEIERQVRIEGSIETTSAEESDDYFQSRPRGSQLAARVSEQSDSLASREELERRVAELEKQLDGKPITRPEHWGGFRVIPDQIEFWQGRPNRLHDRLLYQRVPPGWRIIRLAP